MKTAYNHLTHCYETPDKTTVGAEICEGDTPSDAFRAAAIRKQQRKSAAYARTVIDALYENGDPVSVEAAELLERMAQQQRVTSNEQSSEERVAWIAITEWRWNNDAGTWEGLAYTSPPASKPWVGLPMDEFKYIASKYILSAEAGLEYFQEEIEAKLRGKNAQPSKPLTLWTEAQHERAYRNSPELHKDVKSLAAFKRVAKEIAAMYGIKGDT